MKLNNVINPPKIEYINLTKYSIILDLFSLLFVNLPKKIFKSLSTDPLFTVVSINTIIINYKIKNKTPFVFTDENNKSWNPAIILFRITFDLTETNNDKKTIQLIMLLKYFFL